MDIHRPGFNEGLVSPDIIQQLIATVNPARVPRKELEELEFPGTQIDLFPVHRDGAGSKIYRKSLKGKGFGELFLLPAFITAQYGTDPGDEFPDVERFRDIVVCA